MAKNTQEDAQIISHREMQIKTMMSYPFTPTRTARIRKTTSVGKAVKLEPSYIAKETVRWYCRFGRQLGSPQNVKHGFTTWPRDSAPRYIQPVYENMQPQKNPSVSVRQYYSQYLRSRNNPSVYQLMKRETKCQYPYTGILLSHEREWSADLCHQGDDHEHTKAA